jgi:hypothetical protein
MPDHQHTVLVLGAGASVSAAQGFRPKQPRDHPPLDINFFEKAAHHESVRLAPIIARANALGQPDLASASRRVGLEQYLGRLYFEMVNSRSRVDVEHYYQLVRFYAAELLTTTNWMVGRRGTLTKVLRDALDTSARVTIVTFNHDLLVEDTLAGLPRAYEGAWCLWHAYGGDPWGPPISVASEPVFELDCPGNTPHHVHVFKMHGSLNWVFKTSKVYPSSDFIRAGRTLELWNNTAPAPWTNRVIMPTKSGRGRTRWYLWPLVVPPIYEKQGFIHGRLRDVWDEARDALLGADRVVFWGYSFPAADVHARYFFQAVAQTNDALRTPTLINPDPHAHAALWDILRPRHVHHYNDVRDFLTRG